MKCFIQRGITLNSTPQAHAGVPVFTIPRWQEFRTPHNRSPGTFHAIQPPAELPTPKILKCQDTNSTCAARDTVIPYNSEGCEPTACTEVMQPPCVSGLLAQRQERMSDHRGFSVRCLARQARPIHTSGPPFDPRMRLKRQVFSKSRVTVPRLPRFST